MLEKVLIFTKFMGVFGVFSCAELAGSTPPEHIYVLWWEQQWPWGWQQHGSDLSRSYGEKCTRETGYQQDALFFCAQDNPHNWFFMDFNWLLIVFCPFWQSQNFFFSNQNEPEKRCCLTAIFLFWHQISVHQRTKLTLARTHLWERQKKSTCYIHISCKKISTNCSDKKHECTQDLWKNGEKQQVRGKPHQKYLLLARNLSTRLSSVAQIFFFSSKQPNLIETVLGDQRILIPHWVLSVWTPGKGTFFPDIFHLMASPLFHFLILFCFATQAEIKMVSVFLEALVVSFDGRKSLWKMWGTFTFTHPRASGVSVYILLGFAPVPMWSGSPIASLSSAISKL